MKGKLLIVAVDATPNPGGNTGVLVTLVKAGPFKLCWADLVGKGSAQGERLSAVGRPGPLAAAVAEAPIPEGVSRGDGYPSNGRFTQTWLG